MADKILTTSQLIQMVNQTNFTRTINALHLHHTWKPDHASFKGRPDGLYWQNSMRNYHVNTNGWDDIGQHLTLLPDGNWVTGRNFNSIPCSIKNKNSGGFAIEMFGNFDKGKDKLEGAQKNSILEFAKFFTEKFKCSIIFHREYSDKTCPGTGIDKTTFVNEVKAFKATSNSESGDNMIEPEPSIGVGIINATPSLNVRSTPDSTKNNIITSLPKGSVVDIYEISSNNWGKVKIKGTYGWILMKYVDYTKNDVVVTPPKEETTTKPSTTQKGPMESMNDEKKIALGKDALTILVEKGIINNPDEWTLELTHKAEVWTIFTMMARIIKNIDSNK